MNSLVQIIITVVAVLLGYWLGKKFTRHRTEGLVSESKLTKRENKAEILAFLAEVEEVQSHDIQELLDVADSTVTRYMDELEAEGRVEQHSTRGGAYYTLHK